MNFGLLAFGLAPVPVAAVLLWIDPSCRTPRWRSITLYFLTMGLIIWGALRFVAYIAGARVLLPEVLIVLWFMIIWRLAWAVWTRLLQRLGRGWVRCGRFCQSRGRPVPLPSRLIPIGRASLTACLFIPVFLSTLFTHRCKLADGDNPQSIFNQPYEAIRIPTADGLMLDGWFIPERGAERTIVICHGAGANKGNFIWFLGALLNHGYNVVFFDFRAHGGSDGRTITYGIQEKRDVTAAVNWLKQQRPSESKLIVGLGSSQGALALALAAADEPRIDAIILDSPFLSPRELANEWSKYVPFVGPLVTDWMLSLMSVQTNTNFFTISAEDAVKSMESRPIMIIHGADDFMMPASHSQRLYDVATGPRSIWFGPGPHSNIVTTDPTGYETRVFEFLDRTIGKAPRPASKTRRLLHSSRPAGTLK